MRKAAASLTPGDLESVAVFPLPDVVLFPGALLPLHVFEPRYRDMVHDLLESRARLIVARLRPGFEANYYGSPPLYAVCGIGNVIRHTRHADGKYDILVQGLERIRVLEEPPALLSYRRVRAELLRSDAPSDLAILGAWQSELGSLWEKLAPHLPESLRDLREVMGEAADPSLRADRLAHALLADPDERQQFLEELDVGERFQRLVARAETLLGALATPTPSDLN